MATDIKPYTPFLVDPMRSAYSITFGSGGYSAVTGNDVLLGTSEFVLSDTPDLTFGDKIVGVGFGADPNLQEWSYAGAVEVGGTYIGYLLENSSGRYYLVSEHKPHITAGESIHVYPTIGWDQLDDKPLCFVGGTMIATPAGEVPVESLKPGDMVSLAKGGSAPVTWLGRQTVATRFADPLKMQPIRVMANAIEDGVPCRDLLLSPDHALLVDGLLVHAGALVNGNTIRRETGMPETFVYYHVELENHELILAENTCAETFIDNVDRMAFDNWSEHPNHTSLVEMNMPRAKSTRQLPAAIMARLSDRALEICGTTAEANAA